MNIETSFKQITDVLGMSIVQETLKKLTQLELEKYKTQMEKVKSELIPFERRFGKISQVAWEEFQRGKLGDDMDIMEWMMLYENYLALEKQYKCLIEVEF